MKKCLFLDRDGTINKNLGYIYKYENFIWLKDAKKAIQYAYRRNYLIVIILAADSATEKMVNNLPNIINKGAPGG